ncbi:MAG: hypothetical protein U9N01_03055, partial [Euryarchaeota archaeon]|nr:hypothetical protein [Euryarchaeota archaeon]
MRVKELTNPPDYTTLFPFYKKLFCFAKTFTKNISFFGKTFFSKERFVLKEKQICVSLPIKQSCYLFGL